MMAMNQQPVEDNERTVARTESWYVGDGWYWDGPDRAEGEQGVRRVGAVR